MDDKEINIKKDSLVRVHSNKESHSINYNDNNSREKYSPKHESKPSHNRRYNKRSRSRSLSHNSSDYGSVNSRMSSGQIKGPALNFMIFLEKLYIKFLDDNFNKIKLEIESLLGKDIHIKIDHEYVIQELDGCLLIIESSDINLKKKAALFILDSLLKFNNEKEKGNRKYNSITTLILVPNGLVSIIIGSKGKQINYLIGDSRAKIIVNQPIMKMLQRSIVISGKPENIANAMMMVYKIMEERFYEVKNIEIEAIPLDHNTTYANAKFIFSKECVKFLLGKNGYLVENFKNLFNVELKFHLDSRNAVLERNENIVSLKGSIQSVQDAICLLIKNIQPFIKDSYKGKESFSLKMLILKNFVTKLIGAKGSMIQEIANSSGGATIKILSDKRLERELNFPEIILSIAGSLGPMQDAACIVLEQIECFKNGGPVLSSGKSIIQSLNQQFRHTLIISGSPENDSNLNLMLQNKGTGEKDMLIRKRNRDRSYSKGRSRSRSRSRRRSRSDDRSRSRNKNKIRNRDRSYSKGKSRSRSRNHETRVNHHNSRDIISNLNYSKNKHIKDMRDNNNDHPNANAYSSSLNSNRKVNKEPSHYSPKKEINDKKDTSHYQQNQQNYNSQVISDNSVKDRENKANDEGSNKNLQMSYIENDTMKISTYIIVPDYLTSLLIGINNEFINKIMEKTETRITFETEVFYNLMKQNTIKNHDGVVGRICNIKGTPQQIGNAIKIISENIIKLETNLSDIK